MPILQWLTREQDVRAASRVPYRLLEEAPELSAGDRDAGNMLIQGDNLEALKALLPFYAGRVKCIYIDPPYNTRSAFEHYDDNLEHTQWLAMMWPRLELLRDLLAEDGSIWVSIDDNEGHYLKVIMDEVFGRRNMLANIVWQKIYTIKNSARHFSDMHDHILVFANNIDNWSRNDLPRTGKQDDAYSNPDNDPRGPWKATPMHARNFYSKGLYAIKSPSGRNISGPPSGTYWRYSKESFERMAAEGRIWWGNSGSNIPAQKRFLSEVQGGVVPTSWWTHDEAGHNAEAKNETRTIFESDGLSFLTPKPERLIQRILHITTKPGDLVLDSFLGSGTTAAVAHKMGRRYIGIEMGEHAVTHCAPRLNKVFEAEQGGISKSVEWKGGGGFRFYRLGPPVFDEEGHIRSDIRFPVLAAHIWFSETDRPWGGPHRSGKTRAQGQGVSPFLGVHDGRAYALLYNGVLGDRRINGGNVLTRVTLRIIRDEIAKADPAVVRGNPDYPLTVYGEQSRLTPVTLGRERITFKQTPYDVKARS